MAAQPQTSKTKMDAADYAEQAREAVLQELRRLRLPVEDFRLQVAAAPVLLPEHARLHRPPRIEGTQLSSVAGVVVDPTGAVVPDAWVTLLSSSKEPRQQARTDTNGKFDLEGIEPDVHRLTVWIAGFKTTESVLRLEPGERRLLRLTMEVGSSRQVVRAEGEDLCESGATDLPQAMVSVAAYRRDRLYRSFEVHFQPERPVVFSLDVPNTPTVARSQLPLDTRERRQVAIELAPFYATVLDITRGPERFHPYLPETMRAYGCSTSWGIICVDSDVDAAIGLSDEELRRLTSLWLDFAAHSIWYRFEGLKLPEEPREDSDSPIDADYLRRGLEQKAQTVERMKKNLKSCGVLDAAHLATSSLYLLRLMGEGPLAKESNTLHQIRGLRGDAFLYYTHLYGPQFAVHLHFARINGKLRLVEIELD